VIIHWLQAHSLNEPVSPLELQQGLGRPLVEMVGVAAGDPGGGVEAAGNVL